MSRVRLGAVVGGILVVFGTLFCLAGCASAPRYEEVVTLREVKIHLVDQETLNEKYRETCAAYGQVPKKRVYGFCDKPRNEIYCSRGDERTCGHELFHLARSQLLWESLEKGRGDLFVEASPDGS